MLPHAASPRAVLEAFESSERGLSEGEARTRLGIAGPNVIPAVAAESLLRLLVRQVNNPLLWVLIGSGALAIALGRAVDGAVVLAVVVANAVVGFIQELRATHAIEALATMVPETTAVLRDGRHTDVPVPELVPGDVVMLASGDRVPADARLLEVRDLRVDESMLTGESLPVEKHLARVAPDAPLADRRSMVHGGTLVTYGTGVATVTATGTRTELGRISALMDAAGPLETPLTKAMARVATWLTVAISAVALLLLVIGLVRGYELVEALIAAIALAVGAIPEGLPAIITIALAIGVQRMARRHAVVRRLPAAETLGSTTVICTDKTGTLTRNEMTVQQLWTPEEGLYGLTGVGYEPLGELSRAEGGPTSTAPQDVLALAQGAALCSDATVALEGDAWRAHGDPTEAALVVALEKLGPRAEEIRRRHPRLDVIPFESERRFMATLHTGVALVKGAPEEVLPRCLAGPGEAGNSEAERMAAAGMRVLAVARVSHDDGALDEQRLASGLTLLGLVGMIDPPRPEAAEAVNACRRAGIAVKMITGDHPATAAAVAQRIGILADGDRVLTGMDLSRLEPDALAEAALDVPVFARVAPEHKLALVTALQQQGQVVAMTGDGVNDAPALRRADIGVAMGRNGTAVSREAAEMVLADDNFASIAAAVEEGRRVYDNLVKAVAFTLPTNIGIALIIMLSVLAFPIEDGVPLLPIEPVQLLWINLVCTVALALPLAFEVREPDVMTRPPRRPGTPILTRFMLWRTALVGALMAVCTIGVFLIEYEVRGDGAGARLAESQTAAVAAVVLFQMLYLLSCRSLRWPVRQLGLWSNPSIYLGIGVLTGLQLGFVYLPFMNDLFGSAPLDLTSWLAAVLAAVPILPAMALEKRLRRRSETTCSSRPSPGGRGFGAEGTART